MVSWKFTLHRRNPTEIRHWCAQCSDSKNEHSTVAAKTNRQRCDSSGSDSAEITMCTLVWQLWQLTVLRQRCQLPLLSQWCAHCHHTNVNIAVTLLSVVTAVTLACTLMLQCFHCHRCCTVVSLHWWHANVAACHRCHSAIQATAVTAQLSTPLSQYCHCHRCYTSGNSHCCDISVDSSVTVV